MIKQFNANKARLKRHMRLRNHLAGTRERPRLSVFRSGCHIYAQVIDDANGNTLAAASSLDEALKDFKPVAPQAVAGTGSEEAAARTETAAATETAPAKKSARAAKSPAKGSTKNAPAQKTQLPTAIKGAKKTPVEALAAIAHNHKVALAREVGKLVARRAREKGIEQVVFDRGGYPYHGRVAALAEGAREVGLKF